MSFYNNNNNVGGNSTNFGLAPPDPNDPNQQQQFQSQSIEKYKWMIELVGDQSPFGIYYTKICEILKAKNVPVSRHPSRAHVLSKLLSFLDKNKLNNWLELYIELENTTDTENEEFNNENLDNTKSA